MTNKQDKPKKKVSKSIGKWEFLNELDGLSGPIALLDKKFKQGWMAVGLECLPSGNTRFYFKRELK